MEAHASSASGGAGAGEAARRHPLAAWLASRSDAARLARATLAALVLALGAASLAQPVLGGFRLGPPDWIYGGDFVQDYLLGRALLEGVDPYQPVDALSARFLGRGLPEAPHPTPHPPTIALLFAPLAALPYTAAAGLYFFLQVGFIAATLVLLRPLIALGPGQVALVTVALASLPAVRGELHLGQVGGLMGLLVVASWRALRADRSLLGGVLIGLSVLVKLITWPLGLVLFLRRDWKALAGAGATLLAGYTAAAAGLGAERVVHYFLSVAPHCSRLFRVEPENFSLWTLSQRLFAGTGPGQFDSLSLPPLIASATLAQAAAPLVPVLALLATCLWIHRRGDLDRSLGVMVCTCILVSPIIWEQNLVLAVLPVAYYTRWLVDRGFPRRETTLALAAAALALPGRFWVDVARLAERGASTSASLAGSDAALALIAGAWPLMPAAGVALLAWLLAASAAPRGAPR